MNKTEKGFTLFELLVSMSIVAILTAVATLSFGAAQKKGRDAKIVDDLGRISAAAEQYYSLSNFRYPGPTGVWGVGSTWATSTGQIVLEYFPANPKGVGYTVSSIVAGNSSYCVCGRLDNPSGNSSNSGCTFVGVGGTGDYYCVKNQQ